MYASKGSFEVKLLTRGTDGKAEMGRVREEQRRSKKMRRERVRRKTMQVRKRVEKSRSNNAGRTCRQERWTVTAPLH